MEEMGVARASIIMTMMRKDDTMVLVVTVKSKNVKETAMCA